MILKTVFSAFLKNPKILLNSKNIFLISHMRGNTSLLSHLIGSHPEVEGYYEMHMGYYSWKSLIRQKLRYLEKHSLKSKSKFFFDKVLHGNHVIYPELLKSNNTKVLIMVREPEQTVKSIVSLYLRVEPDHNFSKPQYATEYYFERLDEIIETAKLLKGNFILLHSDDIKFKTEETLGHIADWIGLASPIPTTYGKFENTGKEKCGDSSDKMMSGKIEKSKSDYSSIIIDDKVLEKLHQNYKAALKTIEQYALK